ncbi:MAG TPA: hypothetical protein VFT66_12875 [Roseiflexaceae bacterium]|nr:hypothetical protein [Roseiflexaceae bacterium]
MTMLLFIHAALLRTILLFFGVLMLWGVVNFLRREPITGSYRGALIIGEVLMIAQFLVGAAMLLGGLQPARLALHILYGFVAILALPGTAAFVRGRDPRWANLMYALICLFLCGIALRALETGRGSAPSTFVSAQPIYCPVVSDAPDWAAVVDCRNATSARTWSGVSVCA